MENDVQQSGQVVQRTVEETRVTPPPPDTRAEQALTIAQQAAEAAAAAKTAAQAAAAESAAARSELEQTQASIRDLAELTKSIVSGARVSTPTTNSSLPAGGATETETTRTQLPEQAGDVAPIVVADETVDEGEPQTTTVPLWKRVLLSE